MTKITQFNSVAVAEQAIAQAAPVEIIPPVDRIVIADASGSMYGSIGQIAKHLKEKIRETVRLQDTLTLIWFSGRGEFKVVFERVAIATLSDLTEIDASIDRELRARGLTSFTESLNETQNIITRLRQQRTDSVISLFFMTDGHDNQGSRANILKLCQALGPRIDNAVVVEWGWYCDRDLMTQMAEALGGSLVFSDSFKAYASIFESMMTNGKVTKKTEVQLSHQPAATFAFYLEENKPVVVGIEGNKVLVPEHVSSIMYLTKDAGEAFDPTTASGSAWVLLSVLSQKMMANEVFAVLRSVGDVSLAQMFTNCYSKEDYILFQEAALAAASDVGARYVEGYDPNAVPKEDAFTVLHMLAQLGKDKENKIYPFHEAFTYERATAQRVARETEEGGGFVPVFEVLDKTAGYPVDDMVWNEDRANLSLRIYMKGVVTLPATRPTSLPEVFETYRYRNYMIVKDGIVHMRKLPMSLGKETYDILFAEGIVKDPVWEAGKVFVLDYKKTPVINRQMVSKLAMSDMFPTVLKLEALKAKQKVYNDYRKALSPKVSVGFVDKYGEEANNWLKAIGITEYNGFNPPSNTVKSGDVYPATKFEIKIKNLSSLPTVDKVRAALTAGGALKPAEKLMSEALIEITNKAAEFGNDDEGFKKWIETQSRSITLEARAVTAELAKAKFSILVGHSWFHDAASLDEAKMDVPLAGVGALGVTATLSQVEIEI